jgi:hypothetical protein
MPTVYFFVPGLVFPADTDAALLVVEQAQVSAATAAARLSTAAFFNIDFIIKILLQILFLGLHFKNIGFRHQPSDIGIPPFGRNNKKAPVPVFHKQGQELKIQLPAVPPRLADKLPTCSAHIHARFLGNG